VNKEPRGTESLDVVVRLLFELGDESAEADRLYDRICEAMCRLTSMKRAVLLLYDHERKLVLPTGSHGVEPDLLAHMYGSLEETPIAQRALAEDAVMTTSDLARDVPVRYASIPTVIGLTCSPVAAGGRPLGVIFADAGGDEIALGDDEARTMRALGRTAALATTVREATAQRERGRLLLERVDLARDVHERVIQRLFGVSMALGSGRELSADDRERGAAEVEAAIGELRNALERSLEPTDEPRRTTLRGELERLDRQYKHLPLRVWWEPEAVVPEGLEPLAVSVLGEALRNAEKHADPTEVRVTVERAGDTVALEIRNDGLRGRKPAGPPVSGLGLRLASYEALQRGGMLEFGPDEGAWRVRLVLPVGDAAAALAGRPDE
jgi:signal transduction histidine kinase